MKYFLLVTLFTGLYAFAELPNTVADKKVDDNLTYLDGKANSAYGVTKNFTSSKSTVTVSGWIDIGWERVSTNAPSAVSAVATCSSGKKILGGGCILNSGTAQLQNAFTSSDTEFTCSYNSTVNLTAYAICARVK